MACQDGCRSREDTEYPIVAPALCAVLTVLETQGTLREVLGAINWKEAGVSLAAVQGWWEQHKKDDAERRAREVAAARREKVAQAAYDKLTPAQRKALGVRAPGKF